SRSSASSAGSVRRPISRSASIRRRTARSPRASICRTFRRPSAPLSVMTLRTARRLRYAITRRSISRALSATSSTGCSRSISTSNRQFERDECRVMSDELGTPHSSLVTHHSSLERLFMRFRLSLLLTLFAANVFAVAPQFWRVRNAEDFLSGDIDGFAVTSRGELRPGPSVRKVGSFSEPFVLSQATAPNGDRFFGTGNGGKVYRLRGTELKVLYTAPEQEI